MGSLVPSSLRRHRPSQHPWVKWPLSFVLAAIATLLMLFGLASFRSDQVESVLKPPLSATLEKPHIAETRNAAPKPPAQRAIEPTPARKLPAVNAAPKPQTAPPPVLARATNEAPAVVAPATPAVTNTPSATVSTNANAAATQPSGSSVGSATNSASRSNGQGNTTPPAASSCIRPTEPAFPREAMMDDVTHGELVARLFPDASGKVARLEVLSAKPASHVRYFEREARRAVRDWRCTLAGQDEAVRLKFEFNLND